DIPSALIRSGGGNRPTEARQPPGRPAARTARNGANSAPTMSEKIREGGQVLCAPFPVYSGKGSFRVVRPGGEDRVAFTKGLVCRECGELYDLAPLHVCELCFGPLEVAYDYAAIRADISREEIERGPQTIWRYRKLFPVDGQPLVDIQTGCTPLLRADNLGRALGLRNLYVKNDTVNPTFSFKDRPVTVAATMARGFGFDTIACASTGNLAASVAAHGARAQMRCVVFIPSDLETSKIT